MSLLSRASAAGVAAVLAVAPLTADAAEAPMRQIKGAQIRKAFAGQEFTDEVH